jgi:hypothetical protein
MAQVTFEYLTGLRQTLFLGARLSGSWNAQGRRSDAPTSDAWTTVPMTPFVAGDGWPMNEADVGSATMFTIY